MECSKMFESNVLRWRLSRAGIVVGAMTLAHLIAGCNGDSASPPAATESVNSAASSTTGTAEPRSATAPASQAADDEPSKPDEPKFEFKPLTLNAVTGSSTDAANVESKPDTEKQIQTIIAKLQPLQVLLGQWRGTTRREYENFKAVDNHEWVWDLRTKPDQPALTIQSDKSPYIKTARLTWDTTQNKFVMTVVDPAGMSREFTGDFTDPVHEIVGSDDKLHKVFRLELDQDDSGDNSEIWQFAFAQQENNRYLLEVAKRRGKANFARFDTVSTQREGTSFAVSDTGYAEKTCIISEGLGTMEVTYKGRSYWVCCTGCKAAFEEDPATWIARAAKKDVPK
jgi:hypothetical protein